MHVYVYLIMCGNRDMWKTETDLLIKADGNIPIEIIQTSVGWHEILLNNLPFIITIIVVATAATVTYWSNRKSVESQNEIATKARLEEQENKISEFRHHWLQEVRETASELIQIIHECQYYTKVNNQSHTNALNNSNKEDIEIVKNNKKVIEESFEKLIFKRSEFYKRESKLRLLFKKDDKETEELFSIIESVKNSIGDPEVTSLDDDSINNIVSELQLILKTEWEVTKNRTWSQST